MEQAAGLELDAEAPEKDNFVGGFDGLFPETLTDSDVCMFM